MSIKYLHLSITTAVMALILTSCSPDPLSPGVEYMPDMYRSPAAEPYSKLPTDSLFSNSMEARLPVNGSITRGYLPYGIPNNVDGYEMAGELLKNPYPMSDEIVAEGKVIYTKFCVHCHGKEGNGDGLTVTAGGHPPPPAYTSAALKNLPAGKMFHTITYGKNLMGSHASQLNNEERWKVIRYVQTLQGNDMAMDGKESIEEEESTGSMTSEEVMDEAAMNN